MNEPSFIFTSDNLELKSENENFYVEGYISTSDLDQVNDIVTKNCLLDMAEQMRKRSIKFDVEHESFRGKSNLDVEVNKTIIPVAKTEDFVMDKKGIKVRAVLNKNCRRFDEVKGSIQDGFLDAFSIAYVPVKSITEERNGAKVRLLDKINLLNVAFTGNPVNTEARMTNVFAKSLEFLEDDIHKSDELNEQEVKQMTEEEKETENNEVEETVEEEVKSEESEAEQETEPEKESEPELEEKSEEAPEEEEENLEVKSLRSELDLVKKELTEVKAELEKPQYKSVVEQVDKSENFVEEKARNPLDLIA